MGRADQRTKVKGMFVDPKQIDQIVKAVPGARRARLIVARDGNADAMTLQLTGSGIDTNAATEQMATITKLKGSVELVDNLPNDGKVIDDQRDYSD